MPVKDNKNTQSNFILLVSDLGKLGTVNVDISVPQHTVYYLSVRQSLFKVRTSYENSRV